MEILTTGNEIVDELGKINLHGNIIPHSWYQTLKLSSGKPDTVSMLLLSDFIYWYRPTYLRDEETGQLAAVKKKFKGDLLQKSYKQLTEQFGFSEKQIREALKRLEEKGVLSRVFKTVDSSMGKLPNTMFIELHVSEIVKTCFPQGKEVFPSKETPISPQGNTITKITTESTTQISTVKDICPPYAEIVNYLNEKAGTRYKPTSNKTQSLIKARFNEKFTLEDFKAVIDKKCAEWLNKPNMVQYLRPETLFGTKFEGYLNQQGGFINAENDAARQFVEENGLSF
jgi:uncharacterized phage protein (TIGR02220 family)